MKEKIEEMIRRLNAELANLEMNGVHDCYDCCDVSMLNERISYLQETIGDLRDLLGPVANESASIQMEEEVVLMKRKVDFNELIKLRGVIPDEEYNRRLVDLMSEIGMKIKIEK